KARASASGRRKRDRRDAAGLIASFRRRLSRSQRLQQFLARMSVLRKPQLCLYRTDRLARARADTAVDLAVIVAVSREPLLQFLRLGKAEPGEGAVPVAGQLAVAGDLVGKQAHRQGVA